MHDKLKPIEKDFRDYPTLFSMEMCEAVEGEIFNIVGYTYAPQHPRFILYLDYYQWLFNWISELVEDN